MVETVKGLNIKLTLDGKDLENELNGIKKDLKEQNKDLKAINTNLRYDSSNLDLWKSKQGKLNDVLTQTKKKLETQNQELDKAKKAVQLGDMSQEEFNKLKRNVQYTEAELSKLNNELGKTNDKIRELSNAKFDKIGKLGSTLTKSLTVPILGAVTALTAFSVKAAYTADSIGDTAQKIGLTAEAFQEWNHVATIMGSSTESLNKAFIKVNGILGDIATGNADKVADSLAMIGLSVDDLKGKNADEAFEIISEALSKVEDEALRVGVANEFFGEKIGTELIPILSSEISTIRDLRQEARDTYEQVGQIIENYSERLAKLLTSQKDTTLVETLTFCFREIIRNVVEHSQAKKITFCAQYWPYLKKAEIVVLDRGQGIRNSLNENSTLPDIETDKDALNFALLPSISSKVAYGKKQKRKSDDFWKNSGFGLYMTHRIAGMGGDFFIASGRHGLQWIQDEKKDYKVRLKGTILRMVVQTNNISELQETLGEFRADGFALAQELTKMEIEPSTASLMLSKHRTKVS